MRSKPGWIGILMAGVLSGTWAVASPPNTPVLDGIPNEYDANDLVGSNTLPPDFGPSDVLTNLYVTWDATYVYVALEGRENGNKLAIMIDVDPDAGTGATSTTNWVDNADSAIGYNDVGWSAGSGVLFGLDYMIASEGFYNNILRVGYDGEQAPVLGSNVEVLFDQGNGAVPQLTPVDMVILANDDQVCTVRGIEARIPWAELYGTGRFGTVAPGQVVPAGSTLRIFANLHNNDNTAWFSAPDAIPEQDGEGSSYTNGHLITGTYIDVIVDGDVDGFPDLGVGDVNAPYLRSVTGAAGGTTVLVQFNEPVEDPSAVTPSNYLVGGTPPTTATRTGDPSIRLDLAVPLPAEGSELRILSFGVEDAAANARTTEACLAVSAEGVPLDVTVTFVLETASGFGPDASAFHLNSPVSPLEEGGPPAMSTPLALTMGSVYSVDVTFPAGTSPNVPYRYSGLRIDTGSNTYEAVRLADYASAQRLVVLNHAGIPMTVHDNLGAAAAPYRTGDTGYDDLYLDPARGDAGVSNDVDLLFQLDLSQRNLTGVKRVMIQGSDPLRGFNVHASGTADFGGDAFVGWRIGGIDLVDDGSQGDLTAGDGIFSLEWRATPDGFDAGLVDEPGSLVGGDSFTPPYGGSGWNTQRSPRSIAYKYYVVNAENQGLESPGTNLELYIEEGATRVVPTPFPWDNDALPIGTSTNPAVIVAIQHSGDETTLVYSNIAQAADNAVEITDDPTGTWTGYGLTGTGAGGLFTAVVADAGDPFSLYRVVTPGAPRTHTWWMPHPVPATGGTIRIFYDQNKRDLAGERAVKIAGTFNNWTGQPMVFDGRGRWHFDLEIDPGMTANPEFKLNNSPVTPTVWEGNAGNNYVMPLERGGASWTPNPPQSGGTVTITFDATQASGAALVGTGQVYIWYGFDNWEDRTWSGGSAPGVAMNSIGPDRWEVTVNIPTEYSRTLNWVFNSGPENPDDTTQWQNNFGTDWHTFLGKGPSPYPGIDRGDGGR